MDDKQCIHYWFVDSMNVGRCRHCGAVEDFGALMRREERKSAGLKTVSPVRSAAAKERWQDPEYQAKQSAAHIRQHNKLGGTEIEREENGMREEKEIREAIRNRSKLELALVEEGDGGE